MSSPPSAGPTAPRLLTALLLLWLAGASMRIPLLAVPPVIRLIHDDLHMSETQVGLLVGIPIFMFALAAIPGSLLISWAGAGLIAIAGLLITALASAGRAAAYNLWTLYAMTVVMGFGVAVMQPALQSLIREWAPGRIGLATAVSSNGLLVGVATGPALTIPFVLPLVGQSWRLDLLFWSAPGLVTTLLFILCGSRSRPAAPSPDAASRRWWPDWNAPLIWLLGLAFGSNNAFYYGVNGFLPDYLNSAGHAALIGPALGSLNVAQLVASFVLLATAERLQHRAWPYLIFGPLPMVGVFGMLLLDEFWIVVAASLTGFSLAVTFVLTFALPPVLSPKDDVHRLAGGMFAISYAIAVIVPVLCGAFWDLTGIPWTAFVPLGLCAVTLTVLGVKLTVRSARARA